MKFNLKFKILLSISALLVFATAANLIYSYRLFVGDKESYIYESILRRSEYISDQINQKQSELESRFRLNIKLLSLNDNSIENLISSQSDLIYLGYIEDPSSKPIINESFFNKAQNTYGIDLKEITNSFLSKQDSQLNLKPITRLINPKPNLYLMGISYTQNNHTILTIYDISRTFEFFSNDSSLNFRLIGLNTTSKSDKLERTLLSNKNKKGALKIQLNDSEFLVGYSTLNNGLIVASLIDTAKAFSITSFLIIKNSIFSVFLLLLGLIGGIFFASSISRPVNQLNDAAKKLATGDFDQIVEVNSTDELKMLSNTFNFMSSEIKTLLKSRDELILKLEDYSKNLEKKVAQRTIELKEANDFMGLMINSLDQGLLVFDQDLNCHPMFTTACNRLFGVSPLDKKLYEVLNITSSDAIKNMQQWSTIIFSEMIPFESAVNLGPRNKITGQNILDDDYKHIQIDYYPMRNDDDKIFNLVLIATDKTKEIQATHKSKENESYVAMILKILNNKTQFESFINEVEEILNQFIHAYSPEEGTINFEHSMILFHTLNGGFGIYNINQLQSLAREYESEILNVKNNGINQIEYIPKLQENIEKMKEYFLNFRKDLDKVLGTKFAQNIIITEVPREKILDLKPLIYSTHNTELINNFSDNLLNIEIKNYFKAYDDLCKSTAVKLGKNFSSISFKNGNIKIEPEPYLEFFNVLVHLFRNCMDHGLEDPYTREIKNKPLEGRIEVLFSKFERSGKEYISIQVTDDGNGIDPKIIRSKLSQINPHKDFSSIPDDEIIYKIFDPYFSTRDEVSSLSGRGVGMSAIKDVVDKLNGRMHIKSVVGVGSRFSFELPINR